jgi:hypothetical protein
LAARAYATIAFGLAEEVHQAVAKRTSIVSEFILFMRERKAYWMAPIIVGLLLLALLVVLGNTAGAPFIYTLF